MKDPQVTYERREEAYNKLRGLQKQTADRLSNYRLITVILGLAFAVVLYLKVSAAVGMGAGAVTILLFLVLASRHRQILNKYRYSEIMAQLNQKGLERLNGAWVHFPESGSEFRDEKHPYAADLDLFGQASLYQWLNSAQTPLGKRALNDTLKYPPQEQQEVLRRQEAVTELAFKLAWRQGFETEGILISDKFKPLEALLSWADQTRDVYLQPRLKYGVRILPAVTLLMILLYVLQLAVPWQVPTVLVIMQILLLRLYGKERAQILGTVYPYEASLKTYAAMLKHLEKEHFTSALLLKRQGVLRDLDGHPAFQQIHKLSKIVERISNRQNAMFIFVNILLLWDYQCMIELEEWKKRSGKLLRNWLAVLAELEALSSLAHVPFENRDWVMPQMIADDDSKVKEPGILRAHRLGHPLLTRKRIVNDFALDQTSGIALITGSNMSGKSTFLRTVGINLVLAYIGVPVCAEEFTCSRFNLWTCMRVSDNLEQSISSFYAEILRIKEIVQAAKTDKPVFFLLDEIFKGTNSHDRHQGAAALITQLQKEGAMGLVSTHDLELGELEGQSQGRIRNYHFREYYENQEIHFDYRLQPGISTTRNALYLIRLAGIEVKD